ncbi:hypothetical protein [Bifidobacterium sp. SO4]|uniref:hypothetical protein n=1 Tax=Bifidobacterium sp. SO4 TaxID=2809030 RepID=UPI001BDC2965|nr:hypothetical protein [Bifidobacterium sp. SO4]MBT1171206.1 hypothetical protein [Bifidobacterium sp. SO4]
MTVVSGSHAHRKTVGGWVLTSADLAELERLEDELERSLAEIDERLERLRGSWRG